MEKTRLSPVKEEDTSRYSVRYSAANFNIFRTSSVPTHSVDYTDFDRIAVDDAVFNINPFSHNNAMKNPFDSDTAITDPFDDDAVELHSANISAAGSKASDLNAVKSDATAFVLPCPVSPSPTEVNAVSPSSASPPSPTSPPTPSKKAKFFASASLLIRKATTTKKAWRRKLMIQELRIQQSRGEEWWAHLTTLAQHSVAYGDDLDNLLRGVQCTLHGPGYHADDRDEDYVQYRCDIHAANAEDFANAEAECKQLVIEAGGLVMDKFEYVGGFVYALPIELYMNNPLDDGDETVGGGHIVLQEIDISAKFADMARCAKEWPRERAEEMKKRMYNWLLLQRQKHEEKLRGDDIARALMNRQIDADRVVMSPRITDPGFELSVFPADMGAHTPVSRPDVNIPPLMKHSDTIVGLNERGGAASPHSFVEREIAPSLLGASDDGSSENDRVSYASLAVVGQATVVDVNQHGQTLRFQPAGKALGARMVSSRAPEVYQEAEPAVYTVWGFGDDLKRIERMYRRGGPGLDPGRGGEARASW